MLFLGCHLSAARGNAAMVRTALELGANTFAYFTRNPRGSHGKELDLADCEKAVAMLKAHDFGKLVAHGAYTMNLCTAREKDRAFAAEILKDDLHRVGCLPGNFYNFHPGSHVGQGVDVGIRQIADALKYALEPDEPVTVLLETMAGKGSEVGSRFEELKAIIDLVGSEKLGVCMDTCHVYDAGYDIVNDLDGVLGEFNQVIGLDRLYALHLNDSKNPFASHKDRHACIGSGTLGLETFRRIVNHPQLKGKPMILETPNDLPEYAEAIVLLRQMEKELL